MQLLKKTSEVAGAAALLAMSLFLSACTTRTAETAPNLAVPVTVAKAEQKTVPINLTAIGTAEAFSTVSIKSQVNAILEQVHFKQGDFVKKGDLLFTLDARPFQSSLAQAQANLARDKAQEELNQVQATRYEKLYAAGVSPKEQYDQMRANADAQQALVHADEAAVESAKLSIAEPRWATRITSSGAWTTPCPRRIRCSPATSVTARCRTKPST